MSMVQGKWGFYALRLLLGFAEAGFFPGIVLYLTYWFPARQRARAMSFFMIGSPVAGIISNPVSGVILDELHQVAGLAGWQWLFLLEGSPAVILGIIALFYLTDRPQQATWLDAEERDWLAEQIADEERERGQKHGDGLLRALREPRIWLLILLYFTVAAGANTMGFYLPKLVKAQFPGENQKVIGLLSAIPSICAIVAIILVGTHSDRTGERRWHVAIPAFFAACGWVITAWAPTPVVALAGLAIAQAAMLSMLPPFWSLTTAFLTGTAAAGGIAFINSLGNLGGFAGPSFLGSVHQWTGSFEIGLMVLAGVMFVGGLLALSVRHDPVAEVIPVPDAQAGEGKAASDFAVQNEPGCTSKL
jgi:ACS family tartrate transporter-like MFS transporter